MLKRLAPPCVMLLALTACGGGGGSSLPATNHSPAIVGPTAAPTATQSVKVSISIPAASTTASGARRPAYVSAQTQSASIAVTGGAPVVVNLAPTSAACTPSSGGRTCTMTVNAPVGTDTFVEKLYASTNATGSPLSQGQTSFTVIAGKNNVVNLTLGGVPASIALTLANPSPPQGTAAQIGLTVMVNDAAGSAIIGSDPFTAPITLTDSDTSGATSISKTQLTSPSDAPNITVAYSGAALTSPAVFGATASGVAGANVSTATLTPQAARASTAFNDYTTFGYDNGRDVFNPNSTAFTPASVANIHLAWQAALGGVDGVGVDSHGGGDYNTQTQPVLATGLTDSKGVAHSGVLLVGGGGSGNVYGFDATTGALVWNHDLGVEQYTCSGIGSINFGIGGTVAYDSNSKSFYVVGNSNTAPNAPGQNVLYHMSAASGAILNSVNFAPTTVGPSELNFSHTSVTLGNNGLAYVGTAATCDISSWRGRVAAINVSSMSLAQTFFTVWNGTTQPWGGGGVWGWGGVSLDGSGNVYTGTGNTDNGSTNHGTIAAPFAAAPDEFSGNGDAFLKLSSDLGTLQDSDHPIPQTLYGSNSDAGDLDINGTPVIFTPNGVGCDTMAAIQGKSGSLYMYDTTRVGSGPVAKYQLGPTSYTDEFIGDPAYSPATGLLYAPAPVGAGTLYPPGMIAIDPGCGSPVVRWHSTFGPDSDVPGGHGGASRSVPAVSAGGVVFVGTPCQADASGGCSGSPTPVTSTTAAVRKPKICCAAPGNTIGGAVWALDASSGEVLNGGKPLFTTPGVIRVPPTIDGNWLFVLDNGGDMYGLTIDPSVPSVASKYRSVDARSRMKWEPRPAPKQN